MLFLERKGHQPELAGINLAKDENSVDGAGVVAAYNISRSWKIQFAS